MTDRVHSLTVTLERNNRIDDIEQLISAIRMFEGVADVVPVVADSVSHMAEVRARQNLEAKIYRALAGEKG